MINFWQFNTFKNFKEHTKKDQEQIPQKDCELRQAGVSTMLTVNKRKKIHWLLNL